MTRFLRTTMLCTAVATTAMAVLPASAGQPRQDEAGLIAAGAEILAAITTPEPRGRLDRSLHDVVDVASAADAQDLTEFPEPKQPEVFDPRTREWYKYCENSYRVFKRTAIIDGEYQRFSCNAA
ncbi:MAG: hypothetical protein AB7I79_20630 [Rhizobiaceae bacterium]